MKKVIYILILMTAVVIGQKRQQLSNHSVHVGQINNKSETLDGNVPKHLSYQGLLTKTNGKGVQDGTYQIIFRLYPEIEGETPFWEETQDVDIDDGIISVTLGETVPIDAIPSEAYLEIEIEGTTLSPRQEMTSVFYAMVSDTAKYAQHANYADLDSLPDLSVYAKMDTLSNYSLSSSFDSVAYTGDYNDLNNLPDLNVLDQSDTLNYYVMTDSLSAYTLTSNLALVSTSNLYTDLDSLPDLSVYATNDTLGNYTATSDLSAVATSNDYDDLSNAPDLSVYATNDTLGSYTLTSDLDEFATLDTLDTYVLTDSLGTLADQNADNVNITGGTITDITAIAIADGGTGASDNNSARSNLGLEIGVDVQAYDADLADLADGTLSAEKVEYLGNVTSDVQNQIDAIDIGAVNSLDDLGVTADTTELNYVEGVTSSIQFQLDSKQIADADLYDLAALSQSDGDFIVSDGSSWTVESGDDARTSLGLGSIATQETDNVSITGGSITGITDIAIADGGTAASDITTARSNLGLEIGVDVQAYDADLADLADGELSASKVENNEYFISSAGTENQVWTSDGDGAGVWDASTAILTGAGSTIDTEDLTASVAMVTDSDGKVAVSAVTSAELGYVDGVTSAIQTQIDAKQAADSDLDDLADGELSASKVENNEYFISSSGTNGEVWISDGDDAGYWGISSGITGAASTIDTEDLTAKRAIVSNIDGKIAVSDITAAELGYLDDVSSNVQTQLDAKQALDSDLTDLAGLSQSDGNVIVSDGTNWVTESGADARTSIGLGSIATQDSDNVTITGGNISGVSDIAISDGGTGASDITTARSNLGVEIGVDIQAYDADLADLADGELSASKVENNEYFISSAGTANQVWTSDGTGAGDWAASTATLTGAASTIDTEDLTASVALVSDSDGKVAVSAVTSTELGYVDGVTSEIQTQIDAKQAADSDLDDLADGELSASKVENNEYFISSAGTANQVWTSDGSGAGAWAASSTTLTGAGSTIDTEDLTASVALVSDSDGKVAVSAVTSTELGYVDGVTSAIQTQIDAKQAADSDLDDLADGELSASKVENNEYFISSAGSANQVWTSDGSGAGAWAAASTTLTGAASTIDTEDLTASVAMVTDSDGKVAVSAVTSTELGYVDGVTSAIQTQIDAKQAADDDLTDLADGTLSASKVENNEYFISSAGSANQVWTSDGSGAGAWSTPSTSSTTITVTDNENTDEGNALIFAADAELGGGTLGLESDGDATYNPSTGTIAATNFSGNLTGTLQTAAQGNVTSLGTLTTLTVDNVITDGTTIGHTDDADLITLSNGTVTVAGTLAATTLSGDGSGITGVSANAIKADDITAGDAAVTISTATGAINITPASGSAIVLDGAVNVDAGVVTGVASLTASGAVTGGSITDGTATITSGALSGATTITASGLVTGGSLDIDDVLVDGTTIGHTDDTDLMTLADGSVTFTGSTVIGTADVNGGAIDGAAIGANSASTGAFTTVTASSAVTANANLTVGNGASTAGSIVFNEDTDDGSNTLTLKPAAMAADVTLTLPVDDGTANQVLVTDGSGALSWATNSSVSDIDGLSDAKSGGSNFSNSIIVGHQTTGTLNSADENVGVGYGSLQAITEGDQLTGIGYNTLNSNTTGERNTAIGNVAMSSNTTGSFNAALGYGALESNTTGRYNVAVGNSTLNVNTEAKSNSAFGHKALVSNVSGDENVGLGRAALGANTASYYNTAVGSFSLQDANRTTDTYGYNVALGHKAGNTGTNDITTGNKNTLLGASTAASGAAGTNQTVIGYGATGKGNNTVTIGNGDITAWSAADDGEVDLGSSSVEFKDLFIDGTANLDAVDIDGGAIDGAAIGANSASTGAFTTVSASGATDLNSTLNTSGTVSLDGSANELRFYEGSNYVGFEAPSLSADQVWALPTADGSANQALVTDGSAALSWSSVATNLDGLSDSKSDGTNFTGSLLVGHQTTGTLDAATYNSGVGLTALDALTSGDYNTAVGYSSLTDNTTGAANTAHGYQALFKNTTGDRNTAIGHQSLYYNTSGSHNIAIGYKSLVNTTGNSNTGIGNTTLNENTTGQYNVAVGANVLRNNTAANYNTAMGYSALYDANRTLDTDGYNTALGFNAGNTGTNDVTTGNLNTLLGASTAASAAAGTNQTVIGYGASGKGDNTVTIGNGDITVWSAADDGEVDLGSSSVEFKDLYIDGTANLDAVDIDGGAIDGAAIGANSASTGAFTTVSASGATDLNSTLNTSGTVSLDGSANELRFYEGSNYVGFEAPALSADQVWALPTADGSANQVLATDGGGALSWATPSTSSTTVTVTDNESTNEGNALIFAADAELGGGTLGLESDGDATYNPSTGTIAATNFSGTTITLGGTAVTSTAAELNINDGGTSATSTTVVDADRLVLNDNGTMVQVAVTDLSTYIDGKGHLNSVTENSQTGWRFSTATAANYGDIGTEAVDMSYSASSSSTVGATGDYSTAMGYSTTASGSYSTAMGYSTTASGSYSTSMGYTTLASESFSTSMGRNTNASGNYSTAMGYSTAASGSYSTSMGQSTNASGSNSTSMGTNTNASGSYSTSMGFYTTASGSNSTAMGQNTTASGSNSTAMGQNTIASDYGSLVMGKYNSVGSSVTTNGSATAFDTDNSAFVIGNGTASGSESDALVVYSNGNATLGGDLTITGNDITFGNAETISNSTDGTVLINGTVAGGTGSAAGVFQSNGDNDVTLQTGNSTTGSITITDGANGNIAITPNGTGEVDISKIDIASGEIDGTAIGANSATTGAFTTVSASGATDLNSTLNTSGTVSLDGSANELRFYEGSNYVGFEAPALSADQVWALPTADGSANQVLATDGSGVLSWATAGGGGGATLSQVTENSQTGWRFSTATAANYGDIGTEAVDMSYSASSSSTKGATGDYSTAMGQSTIASGSNSTAMGQSTNASGSNSTAMGYATTASGSNSTAMGYLTNATGIKSTAMGQSTNASGSNSTAMGYATTASGSNSTAMGYDTYALGSLSTSMGRNTTASGEFSTAMGYVTAASGSNSTAMGQNTIASDYGSLVMGKYNSVGSSVTTNGSATAFDTDNSAFVIGNGTASGSESDALVVYSNGNATLGGDLTITGNDITFGNAETISNSTDGTVLINGTVAGGTGSAAGVFQSNGDYDITLQTGNSTTGSITITDGANGDIAVAPNGTGETTFGGNPISNYSASTVSITSATTLATSHNGKVLICNSGSDFSLTIPEDTLPAGFNVMIVQKGAGEITLAAASGNVTINNRNSHTKTANTWAIMSLICIDATTDANVFVSGGDGAS